MQSVVFFKNLIRKIRIIRSFKIVHCALCIVHCLKALQPRFQFVVDPRFQYVTRGICPYVEWLGVNENPNHVGWATAVGYGTNLVERIKSLKSY